MKPLFTLPILLNAGFDGLQVRQKIAVGENHAARLAGGAGSEQNLSNIRSRGLLTRNSDRIRARRGRRHGSVQIVVDQRSRTAGQLRLRGVAQDGFHLRFTNDALNELEIRGRIHRHGHGSAKQNGPESGDPRGRVRAPEKYAIARANSVSREHARPRECVRAEFRIWQRFPTVAACFDDGRVLGKTPKRVEQREQVGAGHD